MANPRRSSFSLNTSYYNQSIENNPYQTQPQTALSALKFFLKKPQAFPFLLSLFLLLTWVSLRLQHSARFSSPPHLTGQRQWSSGRAREDDRKANLFRFPSGYPSRITKDKRGWLLDPLSLALDAGISGGAVICASIHVGEIQPGGVRGNHRHYACNETFLIWGAKTVFRLENSAVDGGYAEATVNADEVAIAASPHGIAHALVNVDSVRSTFFMGCQDSVVTYNSSTTDFNVWKDI
ncbi:UDP-2-acetamido-2,6-beta-L-arabino-hexul-4-ose reductase [Bertholletia excelsa]